MVQQAATAHQVSILGRSAARYQCLVKSIRYVNDDLHLYWVSMNKKRPHRLHHVAKDSSNVVPKSHSLHTPCDMDRAMQVRSLSF